MTKLKVDTYTHVILFIPGKQSHGIEEYSFSQSTLEQVFLEFAKQQKDEADEDETDETEASSKHRVSIV